MKPLTESYLKEKGFKVKHLTTHWLEINLPYPGQRVFVADLMPHDKWIVYYTVNGFAASKVMDYEEEVELLFKGVTGKELKGLS